MKVRRAVADNHPFLRTSDCIGQMSEFEGKAENICAVRDFRI